MQQKSYSDVRACVYVYVNEWEREKKYIWTLEKEVCRKAWSESVN